ncbi:hypothetical protein [Saccharothrix australiensis]|uniref:Uncharacterized protein n=1 Tax=Saccharothrix australiensis TaxID=2072 RepID=A0A495VZ63_9PSEU|nr:hypothetical protein [Saccharothrix australiensis]RKT54646.1 hypothetical protein C8E97_3293 [Saccharothrix australiensis]
MSSVGVLVGGLKPVLVGTLLVTDFAVAVLLGPAGVRGHRDLPTG